MTNEDIWRIAMEQSALDLGCAPEDFLKEEPTVVRSGVFPQMRKYLKPPFPFNLVSYGNAAVASVSEAFTDFAYQYLTRYPAEHLFETPHLQVLNKEMERHGMAVCFMAEYFLPDLNRLKPLDCPYEVRMLGVEDFKDLYLPEWSNALCKGRKELDCIGCGAYDNGRLIGLAGASADCDGMWQIGIDVLPAYRRRGVASSLTSRLALAILQLGKVPFYCAAWSNVHSVRNAIRAGFSPAWVEVSVKTAETVAAFNDPKKHL